MKIICKVKPSGNVCCGCIDDQLAGITKPLDCYTCIAKLPDCEVLQFGHSLFTGDWAIVLDSAGNVERVKLDRVKNVRTEYAENCIFTNDFYERKYMRTTE